MKSIIPLGLALLSALPDANAALPRDIDGSWYSPLQSGHGLTIERIDADHALVFWHVFDPLGNPLTLYVETAIDGDRMAGEAYAPTGMRFGSFDPAEFALPRWGSISIEFTDCTQATLVYDSPIPGFGQGEIDITRLLPLPQPECALDWPADATGLAGHRVEGLLGGTIGDQSGSAVRGSVSGLVDAQGRLWVGHAASNRPAAGHFVVVGEPERAVPGTASFVARAYTNGWLDPYVAGAQVASNPAELQSVFGLSLAARPQQVAGYLFASGSAGWSGRLETGEPAGEPLRPKVYQFVAPLPLLESPQRLWNLSMASDRTLCVQPVSATPVACRLTGRLTTMHPDHFEFVLADVDGQRPAFHGVGRARYRTGLIGFGQLEALELIGNNGETGLYLQLPE